MCFFFFFFFSSRRRHTRWPRDWSSDVCSSDLFLISLFVRPLVKSLGAGSETRGFQLTMAIFAIVSVVLILITFATTKERVRPPPQQKTNAREELGELFKHWTWLVLLVTSIFSNAF